MSHTEHLIGKLKPTNKSIEEFIGDREIPKYYDSKEEYFNDEMYKEAVSIDSMVYTAEFKEVDCDLDIYDSSKNEDGTIDFELKFYNGGCSFSEAIETALKDLKAESIKTGEIVANIELQVDIGVELVIDSLKQTVQKDGDKDVKLSEVIEVLEKFKEMGE